MNFLIYLVINAIGGCLAGVILPPTKSNVIAYYMGVIHVVVIIFLYFIIF